MQEGTNVDDVLSNDIANGDTAPIRNVFFIFENVASMEDKWKHFLTRIFGVSPIELDQRAWTCCSRKRVYWTNLDLSNCSAPGRHGSSKLSLKTSSLNEAPLSIEDVVDPGWMPVKMPLHSSNMTMADRVWGCFTKAAPVGGYSAHSESTLIKTTKAAPKMDDVKIVSTIQTRCYASRDYAIQNLLINMKAVAQDPELKKEVEQRAVRGGAFDATEQDRYELMCWIHCKGGYKYLRPPNPDERERALGMPVGISTFPHNDNDNDNDNETQEMTLTDEYWRRVDRTGNSYSMDHMKWLLQTVTDVLLLPTDDQAKTANKEIQLSRDDSKELTETNEKSVWKIGVGISLVDVKGTTPIDVNQRQGGTQKCAQICQWNDVSEVVCGDGSNGSNNSVTKNELHIMTLNCWLVQDGTNYEAILANIVGIKPTCLCLQEVTPTLFAMLAKSNQLREMGYALFGRLDQEYIVGGSTKGSAKGTKGGRSGITYGLAFLTKVQLLSYNSIPFTQGEGYASMSPAFRAAAAQAAMQHAVPAVSNVSAQPMLRGSSAPLSDVAPLTTQGRYFDVAIGKNFIIANVHAESMKSSVMRDKQFRVIVEHLRAAQQQQSSIQVSSVHSKKSTFLCGDFNTSTNNSEERVLLKYFVDTNVLKTKENTYLLAKQKYYKNNKYIKYYDRILRFDNNEALYMDRIMEQILLKEDNNANTDAQGSREWTAVDPNVFDKHSTIPRFDHKAVHVKVEIAVAATKTSSLVVGSDDVAITWMDDSKLEAVKRELATFKQKTAELKMQLMAAETEVKRLQESLL